MRTAQQEVENDADAEDVGRGGGRGAEILLCGSGRGEIRDVAGGEPIAFDRGDSFLVPAAVAGYRIAGRATLFRARAPGQGGT